MRVKFLVIALMQILFSNMAFGQAQQLKMLVFSGSDWCIPCIQFERNVLSTSAFKDFARDNLEVAIVDFPQKENLPTKLIFQNEQLAEKYNPNGYFPFVILLDKNGEKLIEIKYNKQTVEQVTKQIIPYLTTARLME